MRYYHGSRNGNLAKLTIDKSNDGYVWLAENYEFAVMYAACSVRFWKINNENGKLIIREVCEDSLKKMYDGVKCYIYYTDNPGEFEQCDSNGRKSIRAKHDIEIKLLEVIDNAYEKIIELYKNNQIEIWFWDDYSDADKLIIPKQTKERVCQNMEMQKEKFPEDYAVLTRLFPETSVD